MINCRSVILPLLLCVMAMPVSAASLDCAKADTQAAVNLCAAKELKDADDELARVSKALSKDLKDPAARAALDQAGKAWDAYRDAECRFESAASPAPPPSRWSSPIARRRAPVPASRC